MDNMQLGAPLVLLLPEAAVIVKGDAAAMSRCAPEDELPLPSSQPSSMDTCAPLPARAHSPPAAAKPCTTSSQRSAGTVSGEVAQAASAAPSLKRTLSSCPSGDDDGADSSYSKSARLGSVEGTPARRAAAARARATWAPEDGAEDSGGEGGADSSDGLEFLLRACEMLDPHLEYRPSRAASAPTPGRRMASAAASVEGTPKITRQARHGAASVENSPAALPRRPVSRRLLAREAATDADWAYASDDADADYLPTGRPARGGAVSRAARASARGAAVAATTAPLAAAERAESSAAGGQGGGGRGRWGGEPKQLITGPCMNPDCEHPHDSPQWRKGPPQYPVLCNACGTRWLRNGTLKPLVPRRGLRYKNKPKPIKGKAAQAAAAAAAAQAAAAHAAAVAPLAALPPPSPSPAQHNQLAPPARPASSLSDASEGGDACGLGSQHGSMQLPAAPPLQAALPYVPAVAYNPALAFGPAVFGHLTPAAAAAAAAEAFKNAPQLFSAASPWTFFAPQQQPPALFQPPAAAQQEQAASAATQEGEAMLQADEEAATAEAVRQASVVVA